MTQTLIPGTSLAVQWLGLSIFMAGAWVQSLAGELRSCKLSGTARGEKKDPHPISTSPALPRGTEGGGKRGVRDSPCRSCQLISPPPLRMGLGWVHSTAPTSPPACLYPSGALPPFWPGHCGLSLYSASACSPLSCPHPGPSCSQRKPSVSVISWLLLRNKPAQNLVV